MKYKLQDLIDIDQFQYLQDRLNAIYSFPSAIIDNDGNVLTATAWQDVCTQFHRKNKDCERDCVKSDQYILSHLSEANPAVSYRCPRGLVDNATPIIIDGIHYGNFFTGQFLLEEPDLEFFKKQAREFGFDEASYLQAVKKVPVWSQDQLEHYLYFIKGLIEVISASGLKKLQEIEARKKIEESEERANIIIQKMLDAFWMTEPEDGRIVEVNQAMCQLLGYTYEEMLTMSVADVEANDSPQEIAQRIQQVIKAGSSFFESRFRRKDGSVIDVDVSVTFLPERNLFFGFHRDITERKQAEEQIRMALAEKETLLRELYHRTKNNMNVISAMLSLQAAHTKDPAVEVMFRETENRIQAMSLVHQMLYQAGDLSQVNLRQYIDELLPLLLQGYSLVAGRVALELELEDVNALIDTAIPCGLILNELVSNALKYAFPGDRGGTLKIRLSRTDPQTLELIFSDNGVGVLPGFDFRAQDTLGIQTIIALTEHQLQGDAIFENKNGITWRLRFTDTLYTARV